MAVSYQKLWNLLESRNMKKIDLQHKSNISGNILAKLGKDEYISMESLNKICEALHCNVEDIMEFPLYK